MLLHERFCRITDIDPAQLVSQGLRAVVLDVDNTLTTHDNPTPAPGVLQWLEKARAAGLELLILSNNSPERVRPFAALLGLDFEADGAKPLAGGYRRALRRLGVPAKQAATIGDQIFTDMLGGRLAGLHCIFVEPIEPERGWFFRLKRRLERPILRADAKRRQRLSKT